MELKLPCFVVAHLKAFINVRLIPRKKENVINEFLENLIIKSNFFHVEGDLHFEVWYSQSIWGHK